MIIEVIQDDIDNGQRNRCRYCPIALALSRTTGKTWEVGYSNCSLMGHYNHLHLPDNATAFINLFDGGRTVRPFSFELEYTQSAP